MADKKKGEDMFTKFERLGAVLGFVQPGEYTPSNNMEAFRNHLHNSRLVVVLTGGDVSELSGVKSYRGEKGGLWRNMQAQDLFNYETFKKDPSLTWEFYHHRRTLTTTTEPNKIHYALAELEKRMIKEGKRMVIFTQNVDGLHQKAGSKNVIELHGSLFKTRCTQCEEVTENFDDPICEALRDKGDPSLSTKHANVPLDQLPRCSDKSCGCLLRPHVVFFGEYLDEKLLQASVPELQVCDLLIVIGTPVAINPSASYAHAVSSRGAIVADFNEKIREREPSPEDLYFSYRFDRPLMETVLEALR